MNDSIESHLNKAKKRAYYHWYQDGLAEMALGIFFLSLALLFFADDYWPGLPISAFGLPILILGGIIIFRPLLYRIKARITYPKIGFVSYKQPSSNRRMVSIIIGFGVGFLVSWIVVQQVVAGQPAAGEFDFLTWLPLVQGVVVAIALGLIGYRADLRRYLYLAALSLIVGLILTPLPLSLEVATAIHYMIMGVAIFLSGLKTFRLFMGKTSKQAGESTP